MKYSRFINGELKGASIIKDRMKHGEKVLGFDNIAMLLITLSNRPASPTEMYHAAVKTTALISLLGGNSKNIFLESEELFDFISKTKVRDTSSVCDIISEFGSDAYQPEILTDDVKSIVGRNLGVDIQFPKSVEYIVHIPNKKRSIFIRASFEVGAYMIIITDGSLFSTFRIKNGESSTLGSFVMSNETDFDEHSDDMFYRFCINLFMYMKCFPGCIKDAPPDITCNYKKSKQKNIVLGAHEDVIDRSGVTPHFRSGYFKTLSSKFYKHKRGQVVFVHSTFVKGKAVTVLDDGIGEMQEPSDV